MTSADEEWVKAAMTDDAMVVELLIRLHHASRRLPLQLPVVPLEWSVRQLRSKPVYPTNVPKNTGDRDSPKTALSWSGTTSLSGGSGGGCEESSRPSLTRRSEVSSLKASSKRSRKKKTSVNPGDVIVIVNYSRIHLCNCRSSLVLVHLQNLAELKEEENLLMKERRDLKREISAIRLNLENQRSVNQRLKTMKLELPPLQERELTSLPVLPDLNIPFDEVASSDVVGGAS